MAGFHVTVSVRCAMSVLALVPRGSLASALSAEKDGQTMRREPASRMVHVSPHGEMLQATVKEVATDFCEWDFPLGKASTKAECAHSGDQIIGNNEEMCIKAGQLANAKTAHMSFSVEGSYYRNSHPKGCFYMKGCSEDSRGHCYFYNSVEPMPAGPTIAGQVVCKRDKYKNGTVDSPGGSGAGCATGYATIMHEATCSAFATCMGYCLGAEFRIGTANASRNLDFPQGCFIHKKEGCVYFNPPSSLGMPPVGRASGTPVCNVTSVTYFK